MPVSVAALSSFLSSMFLSPIERNDARFGKPSCQHEALFLCTAAERLRGLSSLNRRTITRCWRGLIAEARNPIVHRFARLRQTSDVDRATLTGDVLQGLAITSIEQCVCSRNSCGWRSFRIGHYRDERLNCLACVSSGEFLYLSDDFGSFPPGLPLSPFTKGILLSPCSE